LPVKDYSTTPASNTSLSGIACGPNMARSDVDNALRQLMADIKAAFLTAGDVEVVGGGSMTSDPTAAINAAIATGKSFILPEGTFNITSALSKTTGGQHIFGMGRDKTVLKKQFNGDVIELGAGSCLHDLSIDGNGATFTGRGVVITEGNSSGTGLQRIHGCRIHSCYSYCVEWTATSSGWGGGMSDTEVQRTGNAGYALKMPTTETNGNRILTNVFAGSGPLIDLDGAANIQLVGCTSGSAAGASPGFTMTAASAKVQIVGGRYATGGGTSVLLGQNHTVVGISHAGPFTLGNGGANSLVNSSGSGNDFAGYAVTDSSNAAGGSTNKFDIPKATYNPAWTAATSAPAIGNGEIAGNYAREGNTVIFEFEVTMGTTTTFGTGAWSFALPIKNNSRVALGTAWMFDASGSATVVGVALAERDATTLQVYPHATAIAQSSAPFTWATGDKLFVSITYIGA
jgi:hypothetical protein